MARFWLVVFGHSTSTIPTLEVLVLEYYYMYFERAIPQHVMRAVLGVGRTKENFGTLPAYILAIGTEYTVSSTTQVPTVFQQIKIDKYNCSYKKMNMITNLRPH